MRRPETSATIYVSNMKKKLVSNFISVLMYTGAIGLIVCDHLDTPNATIHNTIMTLFIIGLIGTALIRWMEQRAKSRGNGKRAAYIASTAYLAFIVIICAWAILEKLGIIRY